MDKTQIKNIFVTCKPSSAISAYFDLCFSNTIFIDLMSNVIPDMMIIFVFKFLNAI